MSKYRTSVLQISREIRDDEKVLQAQINYFQFVLNNVARMTGEIDRKIARLVQEREKVCQDFLDAPKRIEQLELRIKGLGVKKDKLLIQPQIEKAKELAKQLERYRAMGINV